MQDKSCLPVSPSLSLPALIIVVTVAVTGKVSASDLVSVSVYLFLAQETRHCALAHWQLTWLWMFRFIAKGFLV